MEKRATEPVTAGPANMVRPVVGLDAGNASFDRRRRRQRMGNHVRTGFALALLGVVIAAGVYVGFEVYQDQQRAAESESDVIAPDLLRDDVSLEDKANILSDGPRWKGPGNPTFGVGEEP